MSNSTIMDEVKRQQVIAEVENVENIKEFFTQWWSVAELYETAAEASCAMIRFMDRANLDSDERTLFGNLMEQHMMIIDLIKPFERKDGQE